MGNVQSIMGYLRVQVDRGDRRASELLIELATEEKDWGRTIENLFDEPVRAIVRNAVVIALGFTPLFVAPLIPYQTVGLFMALIMEVSGAVTLIVIPSIMTLIKGCIAIPKSCLDRISAFCELIKSPCMT